MRNNTKKLCASICILGLSCLQTPAQAADVTETSDWYNTDKIMDITPGIDTGGSGTKEAQYKLGDAIDWTSYTTPLTITETTTVHMRTLDNAGNVSDLRSVTVQIDRAAPAEPLITPSSTLSNMDITYAITDGADPAGGSGVDRTEYQVQAAGTPADDTAWQTYASMQTITGDGQYTIYAHTFDVAGNVSPISSITVQIDMAAPTEPVITPSNTISNTDITYTITDGTDPIGGSGVDRTEYQVQAAGTPADDAAWQTFADMQTITGDGQYTIFARTLDKAGNVSPTASVMVEIDTLPPDKVIIAPPNGGTSNGDITITIPTEDGCTYNYQIVTADTSYTDDAWQPVIDDSISITDEGVWDLYVKTTDLAGNSSISDPCRIIIDRTAPVINAVTKSTDTYTDEPVTVTIDATDNIQIAGYTFDGGVTWLTDHYYAFADNITIAAHDLQVKDIGGNITTYADADGSDIEINTIGKVPPAKPGVEGDYNSNDSVEIEIDISDPALTYTYQIVPADTPSYDDTAWQPVSETGLIHFGDEGIWHLYLRVHDGISFVVSDPILIVIDKAAPTAPTITEDKLDSKTVKVLIADGTDALSGIRVTHVYVNGEDKTADSKMRSALQELLFNKTGTYQIKAQSEDMVGNLSLEATHTVTIKSSSNGGSGNDNNDNDCNDTQSTTTYNGAFAGGKDKNGVALMLQPNITVKAAAKTNGYIGGYEDGTFRPERNITKAEFAAILNRIISINTPTTQQQPQYVDVKPTHWAYKDITNLQRLNIIPAAGASFYPDQPITRAEISASLANVLNLNRYAATTNDLTDIKANVHHEAIAKVYNAGIVVGYQDNTFKPQNALTRAECVSMLNRTFGIKTSTSDTTAKKSRFKDISISHWAYKEILSASYKQ